MYTSITFPGGRGIFTEEGSERSKDCKSQCGSKLQGNTVFWTHWSTYRCSLENTVTACTLQHELKSDRVPAWRSGVGGDGIPPLAEEAGHLVAAERGTVSFH